MEYMTLANGVKLPAIGFGPGIMGYNPRPSSKKRTIFRRAFDKFITRPNAKKNYVRAVTSAIDNGFRLIDYSAAYGDGKMIGLALKASGVKREDIILTTRVSNGAQFSEKIEDEFFSRLKNFGTDYVDILMFHWPVTDHYEQTFLKMLELHEKGYARILGVANCHAHHLEKLAEITHGGGGHILINQVEVSPLFTQKELINFCREKNIQVEAYTPLARFDDRLVRLPLLKNLAEKYSKTVTQIILRWHTQCGVIPIVRAMTSEHQKENANIFDFRLTDEEIAKIDAVNINARVRYDPDNCDFTIL